MPVWQNTRFSPRHPHPHTPARKLQFLGGAVPPTPHLIAWRRPAVGRNPSSLPKVPQRAAHRAAAISYRLRKCFQIVSEFNSLSVHRLLHLVNGSNYAGIHLILKAIDLVQQAPGPTEGQAASGFNPQAGPELFY